MLVPALASVVVAAASAPFAADYKLAADAAAAVADAVAAAASFAGYSVAVVEHCLVSH